MKDGYQVNCTVSSNFLLDKGRVAENLQKECLVILLYLLLPYGGTISSIFGFSKITKTNFLESFEINVLANAHWCCFDIFLQYPLRAEQLREFKIVCTKIIYRV